MTKEKYDAYKQKTPAKRLKKSKLHRPPIHTLTDKPLVHTAALLPPCIRHQPCWVASFVLAKPGVFNSIRKARTLG
ncbi:MAG: hypothetical protein WDA42_06565 [Candidatus Bathyarchaeia archaeon]